MARISYEIEKNGDQWAILRNGEPGSEYATAEGAFEVVVAQASVEMRSDDEIVIHIRPDIKDQRASNERLIRSL